MGGEPSILEDWRARSVGTFIGGEHYGLPYKHHVLESVQQGHG